MGGYDEVGAEGSGLRKWWMLLEQKREGKVWEVGAMWRALGGMLRDYREWIG